MKEALAAYMWILGCVDTMLLTISLLLAESWTLPMYSIRVVKYQLAPLYPQTAAATMVALHYIQQN